VSLESHGSVAILGWGFGKDERAVDGPGCAGCRHQGKALVHSCDLVFHASVGRGKDYLGNNLFML
jgi:hypothetical protein